MPDITYHIHPAIGIARVGNAPEAFYIGPETANGLPTLPEAPGRRFGAEDFRDGEGRLKRQAARFRIFRRRPGSAPEEVTLDSADVAGIRWTAHLANKKSSWYRFRTTKGQHGYGPNHPLRNPTVIGEAARQRLIIDPGPRSVAGRLAGGAGAAVEFSRASIPTGYRGGSFPPAGLKPLAIETLGALRTDEAGRLLLLGGHGNSGSIDAEPRLADYANNDGWWDDTSDGPVRARIRLRSGEEIDAAPAWVLVAPPSYAPEIGNLVTLYDTILDTAVRRLAARPDIFEHGLWKTGAAGYRPHFETEIRPIFERGAGYPWVSDIPRGAHSFDLVALADPGPAQADNRRFFLDILRGPGEENAIESHIPVISMMPLLAGDDAIDAEMDAGALQATSKYLALTDTQYFMLQQWAAGYFEPGAGPVESPDAALTRGVLENCVGGAFSPGIETGWITRDGAIYAAPFRIRARDPGSGSLSLGIDPAAGLEPGDLTRCMALPWQADFNECATQRVQGRLLWWWPAQRPTTVFLPGPSNAGDPGPRVPWIGSDEDPTSKHYLAFPDHMDMLRDWDKLGFILDQGEPGRPRFVEVARRLPRPAPSGDPDKKR